MVHCYVEMSHCQKMPSISLEETPRKKNNKEKYVTIYMLMVIDSSQKINIDVERVEPYDKCGIKPTRSK